MDGERLRDAAIASPKLTPSSSHAWYDYYAGYSASFAQDAIQALLGREEPKRVLDPWNGSGTTTIAASLLGHQAIGVDRNPALVVIAKGRHLPVSVRQSISPLANDIADVAARLLEEHPQRADHHDALSTWFAPDAEARVRAMERAIRQVLVCKARQSLVAPVRPQRLSTLAAFFYCALFTVVRQLTTPFRASNPTWIRRPNDDSERLTSDWNAVVDGFIEATAGLSGRLRVENDAGESNDTGESSAALRVGSAERMTVDRKVDLVLGSPPYCTRIDYVIATQPELAVLGYRSDQIQQLRRAMLGSPLTRKDANEVDPAWGPLAKRFLRAVTTHPSKASSTYYSRYYGGYLQDLHAAVARLHRVTRRDGTIALVVQDSYYKEAHFDLPAIVMEMGQRLGRHTERVDFSVPRTMASIHPGTRAYRSSFKAVESLVVFHPCRSG